MRLLLIETLGRSNKKWNLTVPFFVEYSLCPLQGHPIESIVFVFDNRNPRGAITAPLPEGQCEATALLATTEHSCSQRSPEGLCHAVTEGREVATRDYL